MNLHVISLDLLACTLRVNKKIKNCERVAVQSVVCVCYLGTCAALTLKKMHQTGVECS